MKSIRFIFALHNHQPVGNFHEVFEKACRMAYHPFLDVLDDFPELQVTLHYSGPLFEWAEKNDPRLVERVVEGVRGGRFELLGGGFGEPILTMLSAADAIGQIRAFSERLRRRYGVAVRGIWLAERVWEAQLAGILAKAGIQFSVVDDFHFRTMGLQESDLTGYYVTEDRGSLLKMFSGSEFLRYSIPFGEPEATVEYLRRFADEEGRNVIVYADDGEKFGIWPETYEHVYERGWLRKFLKLMNANRDWINFTSFGAALDSLPPKGRIYLGDASYREMTEWALPVNAQEQFEQVIEKLKVSQLFDQARPFLRGGSWRNFKVKYVEAAQMYSRMVEVSRLLAEREASKNADEARLALYRGQCNCGYWHGVFGGIYMPFLRFSIYEQLLKAEELLQNRRMREPARQTADFDLDCRQEIKLSNSSLNCYIKPDRGGALYELDDRERGRNLTAVMTRRPEAGHARLVKAAGENKTSVVKAGEKVQSIHDIVRCKEPGLEKLLQYDAYVRESLLDHFYPPSASPESLRRNEVAEMGDFIGASYDSKLMPSRRGLLTLNRTGVIRLPNGNAPVELSKRISLADGANLEIRYVLGFPEGIEAGQALFAVEFNFGLMAGSAPDRNYFNQERENLGNLSTFINLREQQSLGIVDEWLDQGIWLRTEPAAGFLAYPIETVNDSEGGFERVYQGSAVAAYWNLDARPGEEMVFNLTIQISGAKMAGR